LAGRPRWLVGAQEKYRLLTAEGPDGSRLDQWVGTHFDVLRLSLIGLAALVFFLVGFGWVSVLVIGLLLGLLLWLMSEARSRSASGAERVPAESVEGGTQAGSETGQL
jgi:hypothetical protein